MPSEDRITSGPTFGEMLVQNGILEEAGKTTRRIIEVATNAVSELVRLRLKVVSCFTCTDPKTCCSLKTRCYLHEAVAIVARLKRENRDTPELRQQLKEAAHHMETVPLKKHVRPCLFLDADERCTIYEDRPSVCGTHFVSSPSIECSARGGKITKLASDSSDELPAQLEEQFVMVTGLRRIDRPYSGALPRMVLIALEAWERRDYVQFLADRCLPASHRFAQLTR